LVSEQNGEKKVSDPVSTFFKTRKFTTLHSQYSQQVCFFLIFRT